MQVKLVFCQFFLDQTLLHCRNCDYRPFFQSQRVFEQERSAKKIQSLISRDIILLFIPARIILILRILRCMSRIITWIRDPKAFILKNDPSNKVSFKQDI